MLEMLKTLWFDFKLLAALTDHPLPSYKVQSSNLCWNICKTWAINCIIICTWCDFTKSGKLAIYYFRRIHSMTLYISTFFTIINIYHLCSNFFLSMYWPDLPSSSCLPDCGSIFYWNLLSSPAKKSLCINIIIIFA